MIVALAQIMKCYITTIRIIEVELVSDSSSFGNKNNLNFFSIAVFS
jgi:hypothetical protein